VNSEDGGNRKFILCEQMNYVESTERRLTLNIKKLGFGEFVYMEMLECNEKFVSQIREASSRERLNEIWLDMQEAAFLSFRSSSVTSDSFREFSPSLKLGDLKKFLLLVLDKNMMYVPLSEIQDTFYSVSKSDLKMNKDIFLETSAQFQ